MNVAMAGIAAHNTMIFWMARFSAIGPSPALKKYWVFRYGECEKNARYSADSEIDPCLPIIDSPRRKEQRDPYKDRGHDEPEPHFCLRILHDSI
jgi:hypothetical protein